MNRPPRRPTAVSTRMVAERAGVAGGLVHYHFASVRALLTEPAVGVMRTAATSAGTRWRGHARRRRWWSCSRPCSTSSPGTTPVSMVFIETYLAATRDREVPDAVAGVVTDFRAQLAGWFGERGVAAPEATAAPWRGERTRVALSGTCAPAYQSL